MNLLSYLFVKRLYPFYEESLRKRKTYSYFTEYNKNMGMDREEIKNIQWNKLKALLAYSYENVPYYKECFDRLSLQLDDIKSIEDLDKIPVLTKEIIKSRFNDLISVEYKDSVLVKSTGGSTGVPLKFGYSRESYERRTAVMWRGYSWGRVIQGDKTLYLWGADILPVGVFGKYKAKLHNYLFNRKFINTFNLSSNNISEYVNQINGYDAKVIIAYTTPLFLIAQYILDNKITVKQPLSILTGAEPLYDYQREIIEKAFNCEVFNTYGSREVMLMASECEQHNGLHINEDHLIIETVKDNAAVTGVSGNVLVTDLHNYAMPFIRYENGDLATLSDSECSCGLPFKKLDSIDGRSLDCIKTPSGRLLPGEFFPHLLKDFSVIKEFQVIQDRLDHLKVIIVPAYEGGGSDIANIKTIIIDNIGLDVEVEIDLVEKIDKTLSGKHRVAISLLDGEA